MFRALSGPIPQDRHGALLAFARSWPAVFRAPLKTGRLGGKAPFTGIAPKAASPGFEILEIWK